MIDRTTYNQATTYLIRINGILDATWSDWFGGFTITVEEDESILEGMVPDQSALHGILAKINDLGLSLISVNQRSYDGCLSKVMELK